MFDFSALEAAATSNTFGRSSTRVSTYDLPIEEARKVVKVVNGNKGVKEDGSQALTLKFGKKVLPLDVIKKNASRIIATQEQVDTFSAKLLEAVDAGAFDDVIIEAQVASKAAAEAAKVAAATTPVPEALDLDALDAVEDAEAPSELDDLLE